jgi:hypothetical protein
MHICTAQAHSPVHRACSVCPRHTTPPPVFTSVPTARPNALAVSLHLTVPHARPTLPSAPALSSLPLAYPKLPHGLSPRSCRPRFSRSSSSRWLSPRACARRSSSRATALPVRRAALLTSHGLTYHDLTCRGHARRGHACYGYERPPPQQTLLCGLHGYICRVRSGQEGDGLEGVHTAGAAGGAWHTGAWRVGCEQGRRLHPHATVRGRYGEG